LQGSDAHIFDKDSMIWCSYLTTWDIVAGYVIRIL